MDGILGGLKVNNNSMNMGNGSAINNSALRMGNDTLDNMMNGQNNMDRQSNSRITIM